MFQTWKSRSLPQTRCASPGRAKCSREAEIDRPRVSGTVPARVTGVQWRSPEGWPAFDLETCHITPPPHLDYGGFTNPAVAASQSDSLIKAGRTSLLTSVALKPQPEASCFPTHHHSHQQSPAHSFCFNPSTRTWAPISSKNPRSQVTQRLSLAPWLSLTSWNVDTYSSRPVSRAKLILGHILEGPKYPDIIFLQEVTPNVRASLLDDARVRAAFLVTDAEDQTSFEDVSFATMTLLSSARFASGLDSQKEGDWIKGVGKFMLGDVSRVTSRASAGGIRFMWT